MGIMVGVLIGCVDRMGIMIGCACLPGNLWLW